MTTKCRLKINLENFFNDERKFSYILLNPEWKYVNDVKQHIKKLFSLKHINLITDDSFFLPAHESIEVINKGEIIKVIKKRKTASASENQPKIDDSLTPNQDSGSVKSRKKRKIANVNNSLEIDSEEKKSPGKSKSKTVDEAVRSVNKCKNFLENVSKKTKITRNSELREDHEKTFLNQNQTQESLVNDETHQKRKRRRRSRRKNKLSNRDNNESTQEDKIKPHTQEKVIGHSLTKSSGTHLRFSDDGVIISKDKENEGEKEKSEIVFKNYLDDVPEARYIRGIALGTANVTYLERNTKSQQADETEATLTNNVNVESAINDESVKIVEETNKEQTFALNSESIVNSEKSVKVTVDTDKEQTFAVNESVTENETSIVPFNGTSDKLINVEDCLKFSKPLDTLPGVGDILIFRIYRLNEKYEPGLSEYICAKVEEIESETNFIKLLIIEGHDQFKPIEGKFSIPTTINDELDNFVYLKLEEMIEKSVFKL